MFYSVAVHLVKFVFVFIFFLAGFAFSFHIIFQVPISFLYRIISSTLTYERTVKEDKAAFSSPWESLLRTVSMLLGDLDYDGYMAGDKPTPLVGTAHLVYFIFLILVSLILMNLLIGLAVDDITGLQAEGQWRRLRHQANFIVYLENVASTSISSCFFIINRFSNRFNRFTTETG